MGCGASKAANAAGGDTTSEEVQAISSSITQIRDIAPPEVADTGAHPPRRDDIIRRNLYFQAGAGGPPFAIPGVVPESDYGLSSSQRGESLIKMHPPRKPQRLGPGLETAVKKTVTYSESEVQVQGKSYTRKRDQRQDFSGTPGWFNN